MSTVGDIALMERLIAATRHGAAATLAAAIISARGKPISTEQALEIYSDINSSILHGLKSRLSYDEWIEARNERMKGVVE